MRLSVCMIVGQKTGQLPRALASVSGIADEIVIAATAVLDFLQYIKPVPLLKSFEFPWREDFSAARNATFGRASGDWIFWLDADEWLDSGSSAALAHCLGNSNVLSWLCDITDVSGPEGIPKFSPTPLPRIFRAGPDIRLTGRVHEHFVPPLEATAARLGLEIRRANIRIFHDGYNTADESDKLRRNIRLMEMELADRPGQLFYQIRLSQALLKMGDSRSGTYLLQAWEQVLGQVRQATPPAEPMVGPLLDSILVRQSRGEFDSGLPLEHLHQIAARWFPRWPPLLWRRANWQFKQGRLAEAAGTLENILRLAADGNWQPIPSFESGILGGQTLLDLGICYVHLGKMDAAQQSFQAAAKDPQWAQAAAQNLATIAGKRGG